MLEDILGGIASKSFLAILMFFIIVSLFGCSDYLPGIGNPTPTPLPSISPRFVSNEEDFPWRELWRKKANLIRDYQNIRNLIIVGDGILYMDYTDGSWLKFAKSSDGELRWSVDLGGRIDSIVTDGNLVYVVGRAGQIVDAYDLQTGKLTWESNQTLPSHRAYFLQLHGEYLFAYESRNLIYIFDPKTGDLIDEIQVPDIAEEFLLYLENDDWLLSKDTQVMLVKEEEIVWQTNLDGSPQKFPYIDDNILILRFDNDRTVFGGLASLDLMTGELMWQRVDEFYSNFVIDGDLIYVVSKEAKILILDSKSGETIGFAELLPNEVSKIHPVSAIAVNDNMLYVYFIDNKELIAFEKVND